MNKRAGGVRLKAGQVAAVLEVGPKKLANIVDAGYVRPSAQKKGRGSVRLYSFGDVVRLRLFDILVGSYGLERARASRCVRAVRTGDDALRTRYVEFPPAAGPSVEGVDLPPIRLPLARIASDLRVRVDRVAETYSEGQRGRPAGWSKRMTGTLSAVSDSLQGVSDEQIAEAVRASRAARRGAAGRKG